MTGNIFKLKSGTIWAAFTKKFGFPLFTHKKLFDKMFMHNADQNHHAKTADIVKFVQLHFIASNRNSGYSGY